MISVTINAGSNTSMRLLGYPEDNIVKSDKVFEVVSKITPVPVVDVIPANMVPIREDQKTLNDAVRVVIDEGTGNLKLLLKDMVCMPCHRGMGLFAVDSCRISYTLASGQSGLFEWSRPPPTLAPAPSR